MDNQLKMFDVVALLEEVSEKGLTRGQVGTVVEELGDGVYEVEFSDNQGRTYAQLAIPGWKLLVLYYQSQKVA